eukprot:TRINITY_DN34406_c0_g1_i2.p5 TRINITY_DN34406_c0_g1~~TRINITY_DN34406_c0_g1_i2.p5  ORF type:complete len:114 (-),score=24.74 TRINITY_DN34406_c0_g1_i2:959-1300(-)
MAYNLYQVQMANAWVERVAKENNTAERFWVQRALDTRHPKAAASDTSSRISSEAPSGYTSKTTFLKNRLELLERELDREKKLREKLESDLGTLKTARNLHTTSTEGGHSAAGS